MGWFMNCWFLSLFPDLSAMDHVNTWGLCWLWSHHPPETMSTTSSILSLFFHLVCFILQDSDGAAILPSSLRSSSNHINSNNNNGITASTPRKKYAPGTRPEPSDGLPILPLQYPQDKQTLPTDSDLDPYYLQRFMGSQYEPEFMSPVQPVESIYNPNGTYEYNFKNSLPNGEMPEDIRNLVFTLPGPKKKIKVKSKSVRKRIQRYLTGYTYCPVHYKWRDLGVRFWPRWIKEGTCDSSPHAGRSCSIPAGMTCKPKQSQAKTLLWWHCRRKDPCKWIYIQYPIITGCKCSCWCDSFDSSESYLSIFSVLYMLSDIGMLSWSLPQKTIV